MARDLGASGMGTGDTVNEYGTLVASYEGSGSLRLKGGGECPCTFSAFQLRDGHVILTGKIVPESYSGSNEIELAEAIVGITTEGQHLSAIGLHEIAQDQLSGSFAYHAQKLGIEIHSNGKVSHSRFTIVNLILANSELNIEHPAGRARLRRVAGYQDVARRLKTLKGVDVTAELEAKATEPQSRELVATDICSLLSLARGTKVQWISRDDYTDSEDIAHRDHHSRVTKAYCPLSAIDYREIEDTPRFLVAATPTYIERRDIWGLSRGLLDVYLDAKAETDYLQMRGVKLAVALEMLKEAFFQASGYQDLVMPEPQFREMVPDLKEALKKVMLQNGLDRTKRALVYRNIQALNRIPFEEIVASLCAKIDMKVPDQDLKLFVKCRNSLVHTGRFYCERADDTDRTKVHPHSGPRDEYFWLLHFMDRLLLRLVGYQGPYVDWSKPGAPERRPNI